jgi:hypothetical protein
VRPIRMLGPCFGLIIKSKESGKPGKMASQDDSIMMDTPGFEWMAKVFEELKLGAADQRIFPFDYPEVLKTFKAIGLQLKTEMTPYHMRHSGASFDRLYKHRGLDSIQKRGRWKSFKSVTRYEKATRAMAAVEGLSPQLRRFAEHSEAHLKQLLLGSCKPRKFCA